MIYVGKSLVRKNGYGVENCLIDPSLKIAGTADTQGLHLSYWPSYTELAPSSRRAYLEWLAGPRSDPSTPIGYVFLYFYGLERKLMLDEPGDERPALVAEVRRLLSIYTENHSFNRYSSALLAAEGLHSGSGDLKLDLQGRGFEVPISLLIALGVRAREKRVIDPDLLLAFAGAHPETKVRTPSRRAPEEHRALFQDAINEAFPNGVVLTNWGKLPKLKATYRAASGTFEVDLLPPKHGLPDVTAMGEPMSMVRRIFEECSDQLDSYSRELGRSPGLVPTLAAVARLPSKLRLVASEKLPESPLTRLAAIASEGEHIKSVELAILMGVSPVNSEKSSIREMARLLGAFGYGLVADPQFALRKHKPENGHLVFALASPEAAPAVPSEAFRLAQVTVALGTMVALADGGLNNDENALLARTVASAPDLSANERQRLMAEIRAHSIDPLQLADLRSRLKDAPAPMRAQLAEDVIRLTIADGKVDAREVAFIERLFRQIDLDVADLYNRLHAGLASAQTDDLQILPNCEAGQDLRQETPKPSAFNPDRLATIRVETAGTTSILSAIFAEDEVDQTPVEQPMAAKPKDEEDTDGLDSRHRTLVLELGERAQWPRVEFEQLVRAAGLMPGSAINTLNEWSLDRFDELLIEGDDPLHVQDHLLPATLKREFA
jgi:tellurite resistance protein